MALHFLDNSFCVHHQVSRDDRHLLAHAIASDNSVALHFSQREQQMVGLGYFTYQDVLVRSGLLGSELIARKSENDELASVL
jgi:hypothetical protein